MLISAASVLILAGLIATPAGCACGSAIHHAHSLFLLPGHHHDATGAHVRLGQVPEPGGYGISNAAMPGQPRLAALTGHGSDVLAVTLAALLGMTVSWRRLRSRIVSFPIPFGHVDQPDPPPPRLLCFASSH